MIGYGTLNSTDKDFDIKDVKIKDVVNLKKGIQVPSKFGRIAAFLTNLEQADQPERTELELVDCRAVLTEKEISNSPNSFQKGVSLGVTSCIDQNNAKLSKYSDDLGPGSLVIEIKHLQCIADASDPTECEKEVFTHIFTSIYVSKTIVDFTEENKEDYIVRKMEQSGLDSDSRFV